MSLLNITTPTKTGIQTSKLASLQSPEFNGDVRKKQQLFQPSISEPTPTARRPALRRLRALDPVVQIPPLPGAPEVTRSKKKWRQPWEIRVPPYFGSKIIHILCTIIYANSWYIASVQGLNISLRCRCLPLKSLAGCKLTSGWFLTSPEKASRPSFFFVWVCSPSTIHTIICLAFQV